MKKIKAFTIVETLVTLFAITVMIAGPLTFMYRSYHYAEFVKNKMISTGIAQEGLELATSLRNSNLASFKTSADACASGCSIDWDGVSTTPTLQACSDTSCTFTFADTTYNSGTQFYRQLTFTPVGTQSYKVKSVAWSVVDGVKIEAKLDKVMFNISIK